MESKEQKSEAVRFHRHGWNSTNERGKNLLLWLLSSFAPSDQKIILFVARQTSDIELRDNDDNSALMRALQSDWVTLPMLEVLV